jgi:hypothetical protein
MQSRTCHTVEHDGAAMNLVRLRLRGSSPEWLHAPFSSDLSATSQQYFPLRTNRPPATTSNK